MTALQGHRPLPYYLGSRRPEGGRPRDLSPPARVPLDLPERPRSPAVAWLVPAALAPLALRGLAWGWSKGLVDGADLVLRTREVDRFVRGLDPYALPDMTYPPTAPPVFTPLIAPFDAGAVKAVWVAFNLLALAILCAIILRAWGRHWPSWLQVAFCLAVAASKPVRGGMALGQFHLIPTALVLLAIVASERGRQVVAGALMGLALTKPTISLPFLILLAARGRWRAIATALGFQGALMVGVSAWLGIGPDALMREWLARARTQMEAGVIDTTLAVRAWPEWPWIGAALSVLILGAAAAATWSWRRKPMLGLASLSAAAAATFTYHRSYDLVLLIPVLALLVDGAAGASGRPAAWRWAAAAGFAALLIVPKSPAVLGRFAGSYDAPFVALTLAFLALSVADVAAMRPEGPALNPHRP